MTNWLICGCGYLGQRVGEVCEKSGIRVFATTRHLGKADLFRGRGWVPLVGDVTDRQRLPVVPDVPIQVTLFAVGRERESSSSHMDVLAGGLRHMLEAAGPRLGVVIYISSTGVYGDAGGGWVDEQTPPHPAAPGGQACWEAEQLLAAWSLRHGTPYRVLRMAGLYGPGRVPRQDDLRRGVPIPAPAEGFLNLIHVEDAARVVVRAGQGDELPSLLCVSDGQPVPRRDYLQEIARLIQAPSPQFVPVSPDHSARMSGASNKRVSNRRLLATTGIDLEYPSYREGLQAILT